MITQLAAQLMAHTPAQVDVGDRENINSSNNEFHGNRHTSEKKMPRPCKPMVEGQIAASELKKRSLQAGYGTASLIGIWPLVGNLATFCNQKLTQNCEKLRCRTPIGHPPVHRPQGSGRDRQCAARALPGKRFSLLCCARSTPTRERLQQPPAKDRDTHD
ncbi:hypothetical protein [Pseudomonas sp. CF161]|uniref:hypothetical protein n=1 Tax=Pseudomonas sp. CF161 TaxID=911241 RepID=UPI0015A6BB0E|nr:hypothetical protein [Pseudomonas sp. CF161]